MSIAWKVAGLCLALAAGGGVLAHRSASAAGPGPGPEGTWKGKSTFRDTRLLGDDGGGRGAVVTLMTVVQEGNAITVALRHEDRDGNGLDFALTGFAGNGHFYAGNGDPDRPVLVTGHVYGTPPRARMKGRATVIAGYGLPADQLVELDFHLQQQPAEAP